MAALALPNPQFWSGRRVFLTGHTGFKGGWLSLWLSQLGAVVHGYALAPPTSPSMFTMCRIEPLLTHQIADICDLETLSAAMRAFAPDVVFHLAAQPLVRASYADPMMTYATNIMGTANLLEAVRQTPSVQAAMIATSDKVYAESATPHTESARLGGVDPYSASKAASEHVAASFPLLPHQRLATLRSGNVFGGGDWSSDRLLPDFFRAILAGELLSLRNPNAVRPWQHVLDPLCGYLLAAEHVSVSRAAKSAWNFGPDSSSEITVEKLVAQLCALWGGGAFYTIAPESNAPHEAPVLRLRADKAMQQLGWRPGLTLEQGLAATVTWYRASTTDTDMRALTLSQISDYGRHV